MSKELDSIIESTGKRMEFLTSQLQMQGCDWELNKKLWWETYERFKSALAARAEQRNMRWKTTGDFSHLQSTPAVRF